MCQVNGAKLIRLLLPAPKVTPANVSGGGGSRSELVITWEVSKLPQDPHTHGGGSQTSLWACVLLITAQWPNVWHLIFKNVEAISLAITLRERKMLWDFKKTILMAPSFLLLQHVKTPSKSSATANKHLIKSVTINTLAQHTDDILKNRITTDKINRW